jgi:ligand-binding sensor domain-containing protein
VQGNLWIGTAEGGLAKFDGETWTVYNTDNSGLPDNAVQALTFDPQGTLWVGTQGALAQFDGQNWIVYNTDNSELPDNWVWSIAIDAHGNKWIGTGGGLAAYREGGVILSDAGTELKQSTDIPEPSVAMAEDLIGKWAPW